MKNQIFRFLKSYSTKPLEVDRLIVSAYLVKNKLTIRKNEELGAYFIKSEDETEYEHLSKFVEIITRELGSFKLEDLIEVFEFVISPSDRIINGAIYTPIEIRKYIVDKVFEEKRDSVNHLRVADISCGCGGFLLTAAQVLKKLTSNSYSQIFKNQIFGLDIQDYSITRTKLLLSLLALTEGEDEIFEFNLYQGDTLIFNWQNIYENFSGFDVIIGNPPYVCARNLSEEVKQNLSNWSVCKTGNPDLYIPFFQIGFESLSENGILGFIAMNTFFKSLNGRALRDYFKQNNIKLSIIDFGTYQIFKSKSTYTCICFIEKKEQEYIHFYQSDQKKLPKSHNQFSKVYYSMLDSKKGWNLKDNKIISKIESTGIAFGDLYNTRHGIATLKNDIYIFKPIQEDDNYYYLQNGELYQIEKGICRDILNSNKLSRDVSFDEIKEKVIFPYTNEDKPKLLDEVSFKQYFPNAYNYLSDKRAILAKRDKGKGKYENWYAFGRTQSLERVRNKLFFPKMSDQIPSYIINSDENLLFYNGQAIIGHNQDEMMIIKKIMESRLFWYYIKTTSKPYSSDYYSLNGNYISNFGICNLSDTEKEFVLNEQDKDALNIFFERKYDIDFHKIIF